MKKIYCMFGIFPLLFCALFVFSPNIFAIDSEIMDELSNIGMSDEFASDEVIEDEVIEEETLSEEDFFEYPGGPWKYVEDELLLVPGYPAMLSFIPAGIAILWSGSYIKDLLPDMEPEKKKSEKKQEEKESAEAEEASEPADASEPGVGVPGDGEEKSWREWLPEWCNEKILRGRHWQDWGKDFAIRWPVKVVAGLLAKNLFKMSLYSYCLNKWLKNWKMNEKRTPVILRGFFEKEHKQYLKNRYAYLFLHTNRVIKVVKSAVKCHENGLIVPVGGIVGGEDDEDDEEANALGFGAFPDGFAPPLGSDPLGLLGGGTDGFY